MSVENNQIAELKSGMINRKFQEIDGKLIFIENREKGLVNDPLDRLKSQFKKFPNFYRFLIDIISPVLGKKGPIKRFRKLSTGVIINLGSGNSPRVAEVINLDFFEYDNVDLVCDIHDLPFRDSSVDSIMSTAVLEHVREPDKVIKEIYRVLKKGGVVYTSIPFMQPFHASPDDYQRYTLPGIEYLHKDFEIIESGVLCGPVSGFLWVLQDFISLSLSFGNNNLRNLILILTMCLTWPIKFLDLIFARLPTATNIASSFYVIGRKK